MLFRICVNSNACEKFVKVLKTQLFSRNKTILLSFIVFKCTHFRLKDVPTKSMSLVTFAEETKFFGRPGSCIGLYQCFQGDFSANRHCASLLSPIGDFVISLKIADESSTKIQHKIVSNQIILVKLKLQP